VGAENSSRPVTCGFAERRSGVMDLESCAIRPNAPAARVVDSSREDPTDASGIEPFRGLRRFWSGWVRQGSARSGRTDGIAKIRSPPRSPRSARTSFRHPQVPLHTGPGRVPWACCVNPGSRLCAGWDHTQRPSTAARSRVLHDATENRNTALAGATSPIHSRHRLPLIDGSRGTTLKSPAPPQELDDRRRTGDVPSRSRTQATISDRSHKRTLPAPNSTTGRGMSG